MPKKNKKDPTYKRSKSKTRKGRIKHHIPPERALFKGNGYVRFKKLKALGLKGEEAVKLAHNVQDCNKIFRQIKRDEMDEIKGLVKVEEGTGPNQVDINGIFKFERQRDILRRILSQGVSLDEAIPLAREAGESNEPFERVLARRFVREQLSDIRSSSDQISVIGGARKRFRILVSKGVHVEKARTVCQCPVKTRKLRFALSGRELEPTPKGNKRSNQTANANKTPVNSQTSEKGSTFDPSKYTWRRSNLQQTNVSNLTQCKNTSQSQSQISALTRQRVEQETAVFQTLPEPQPKDDLVKNKLASTRYNSKEESLFLNHISEPQTHDGIVRKKCASKRYIAEDETQFLKAVPEPLTNYGSFRVKLAVISPDFPSTIWPTEMLKGIQHFISKAAENDGLNFSSIFASCSFRPGWIAYSIRDIRTAQWFRARVPQLRPYEAFLAVVNQDEVPRSQVFVGYIPEQRNIPNHVLLKAIGSQNNGLRTDDWSVIDRTQRGPMLELVILIDPFSLRTLQMNNYSIIYGYSGACLKPRQSLGLSPSRGCTQLCSKSSNNLLFSTREDERKSSHRREIDRNEREYDRNDFPTRRNQLRNGDNDEKSSQNREYERKERRHFTRRSGTSRSDARDSNSHWRSM